jgi:hypothetical protein
MNRIFPVLAAGVTIAAGCSYVGTAIDAAANKTGEVVGQRVGEHVANTYTPALMNHYNGYLFSVAFGSGGYEVGETPYAVGDWTRWNAPQGDASKKPGTVERAYLYADKEKNQVWRVKYTDGEKGDTITLEAKFSPDRSKLLRMRAKYPNDKEASEVPVNEQTYYLPPQKLTKESIKGATVGTESITVPAGTYKAQHIKYGQPGGGTQEWWLATGVPGGTVQSRHTQASSSSGSAPEGGSSVDRNNYTMQLAAFGKGATTELGFVD